MQIKIEKKKRTACERITFLFYQLAIKTDLLTDMLRFRKNILMRIWRKETEKKEEENKKKKND